MRERVPSRRRDLLLTMRRAVFGSLVFLAGCLGSCGSLYHDPIDLPARDAANPVTVPLDVAWETALVVYSGGSPAPMGIKDATATCTPATQCLASVVQPFVENDDPKLVGVGLAPGPADVELLYYQPVRKETITAHLHLVFVSETLPEIDLGDELPASPFAWKHAPLELASHLPSGAPAVDAGARETSARCEGATYEDGPNHYQCFVLEESAGVERRYATCQHSLRCSVMPGGVLVDGFSLCVERDKDGRVTGAVAESDDRRRQMGTWGQPTADGCLRPLR